MSVAESQFQPVDVVAGPPVAPSTADTRRLAIRGSLWTLSGYGVSQALRLVSNVVLAALLAPDLFGVMTLVTVFMTGLNMFSDIGIGPSLIQNPRGEEPVFRNTAWTISITRGIVLWLASCALAWPAARFYDEPILMMVLPVAGFSAVINGFASTALVLMNRRIQMGRLTFLDFMAQVVSLLVMCVWAWFDRSVWALVAGNLTACLCRLAYSFALIPGHRDAMRWDKESARTLMKFGRWVFFSTLITYIATQSDRLMLGKLGTTADLGVYGNAVALTLLVKEVVLRLASTIQFPALARHMNDGPESLQRTLQQSRDPLLVLTLAGTVGIGLGASTFFQCFYDSRYQGAAWITLWLVPSVWFSLLQGTSDRALLALGHSRDLAMSNLVRAVTTVVCCLSGYAVSGHFFPTQPTYQVAGFVVGLMLGTASGHAYVSSRLSRYGVSIFRTDVAYSALFFTLLVVPALIARHFAGVHWFTFQFRGHDRGVDLAWLVVAAAVMIPTGLWAFTRLRRVLLAR